MQRGLVHVYTALKGEELVFDSEKGFINKKDVPKTSFDTPSGSSYSGMNIRDNLKKGIWSFLGVAFGGKEEATPGAQSQTPGDQS